jgi:hypothetical protein
LQQTDKDSATIRPPTGPIVPGSIVAKVEKCLPIDKSPTHPTATAHVVRVGRRLQGVVENECKELRLVIGADVTR